ncbi:MAG: TIGR04282 family arsenosugar biosynthesis glycosyltransferase [Parasphingorhabdus sp.]
MRSKSTRLVLFTRYPVAGQAKTRLIPAIGAPAAAEVHRKLTERTVKLLSLNEQPTEVQYTGGTIAQFESWLGTAIEFSEQPDGDLSKKLLSAIDPSPVIFFGSDTPDLQASHIEEAIEGLQNHDVVIGPAEDGGYYLIGICQPYTYLFENMPWSTEAVLDETLARAKGNNLTVRLLETLSDCDRPEDLVRWPWLTE